MQFSVFKMGKLREKPFRPIVFMTHGLAVAMFTMVGVLAAARLYKAKAKVRGVSALWAMAFLLLVALLNKSMAAFLYTLIAIPLVLFFTPKTQFRVAMLLAVTVLLYPALRASNLIPVDDIVEVATAQFGEKRASSLSTRFQQRGGPSRARVGASFLWLGNVRSTQHLRVLGWETDVHFRR